MAKRKTTKDQDWSKTLSRVFVVAILIMCVAGFTFTMGFFSIFKTAGEGSIVTFDYTLRDTAGVPVITSESYVAENEGFIAGFSGPLQIIIGENYTESVFPVDIYTYGEGTATFGIFTPEMEFISDKMIGIHENERKTIYFPFGVNQTRNLSVFQYEMIGGNFSTAQIGQWIPLAFVDNPSIAVDNATVVTPIRMAQIIEKDDEELWVRYGYGSIDVIVSEIS